MNATKDCLIPLMLNLKDRRVVIIGGGEVGERRAKLFSKYCSRPVEVFSKEFTPDLHRMAERGLVMLWPVSGNATEKWVEDAVEGAFLVVTSTDNPSFNKRVADVAMKHGALVNTVNEVGDVVVPSIIERDGFVFTVSTKGESPALSRHLRLKLKESLDNILSPQYADMLRLQK
ncbi:MAG: precorrin-2 dehydrogenase/sirohydrochlorin ferrochelatase family protein [Methermicoccaceae archaeon]